MDDKDKSKKQLLQELSALRQQVAELQAPKDKNNRIENSQKTETRFSSLIDQTSDAVFYYEFNPPIPIDISIREQIQLMYEGILVDCNDLYAQYYGWGKMRDVIGKRLGDFFEVNSRDEIFSSFIQSHYKAIDSEIEVLLDDGSRQYYVSNSHGSIEDGQLIRIWGSFRNITEHKKAQNKLNQQHNLLLSLQETSLELVSQLDLDSLLENIVKRATQLTESSSGFLSLVGVSDDVILLKVLVSMSTIPLRTKIRLGEGLIGRVWQTGKPLIVNDYSQWEYRLTDEVYNELASIMAVPLCLGTTIIGVLGLHNEKSMNKTFEPEDLDFLTQFAQLATIAIKNAQLFEKLQQEIVQHQQVEEALQASESRFRQYFELGLVGMAITSTDRSWIEFSDALCDMFGYSREEFAKLTWAEITPPEDQEYSQSQFNRMLAGKFDGYAEEKRYIHKDGSIIHTEVSVAVIYKADGSVDYFVSLIQNITARKLAEESLRKSEEHFRQYFELGFVGMSVTSVEQDWIEFNDAFCEMLGYAREDFTKLTWADITHPDDIEYSKVQINRLLSDEADGYSIEKRYIHRNGSIVYAQLSTNVVREADGSVNRFVSLIQDITERKLAEESLRKNEEHFRLYFELGLVGMSITSVEKGWVEFNDTLCDMFGYTREEFAKRTWEDLTHPDDIEYSRLHLSRLISGETDGHSIQKRYIHSDGSTLYAQISTTAVRKADGSVDYFISLIQDITERKQLEEQKIRQERLAAVGQLAAGIAHDFNNAMAVITLDSDMLLRSSDIMEKAKIKLERIQQQAVHSSRLVQQILDFSSSSVREAQQLDLRVLLNEVFKFVERTIPERIQIQFTDSKGDFIVNADPTQVQQVITNLAVNARDAIPSAGFVHFHLSNLILESDETPPADKMKPGVWVKLTVTDTGSGIVPDIMQHIFEPFYTTKDVGEGTGLGLAQVYGIIKQNDGFITVDSQFGEGTMFTIYLPMVGGVSVAIPTTRDDVIEQGMGETILLVEDNKALLDATRSMLESLNYRVYFAENGENALIEYQAFKNQIDLILCDAVMPQMDGIEFVRLLQQFSPPPKIVMMSGYPINTEITSDVGSFIADWLPKPLNVSQLAKILRDNLK